MKDNQMKCRAYAVLLAIPLLFVGGVSSSAKAAEPKANRWEKAIQAFEALDRKSPPSRGGVLFLGSSSIRKWNLQESFPGEQTINRGFGGSQIVDSTHFAERIVFPYRPRTIVLYAGDNDVAAGKPPRQVANDFKAFAATIQKKLSQTRIVFIAIKPSLARWELVDKMREANASIAEHCKTDARLIFLDIDKPMLGGEDRPQRELFIADGLHLSKKGYVLWTSLLKPHLNNTESETADLILHHGKIVTVDKKFRIAQAIAVRGDRILRVGENDEVLKTKGAKTKLVDLKGKLLLPGLIDSHTHPAGASMHEFDHVVPEMETIADVLAYIKSRAAKLPEGDWIRVRQVFITRLREQRYPTKAELDSAAPKHPVVFATGPDATANSLALKVSGIDKNFKVVGAGHIVKDSQTGEPTGLLRGGTARYLKTKPSGKKATDEDRTERLIALFKDYNSVGLTCVSDRNTSTSSVARYQKLYAEGKLTVRMMMSRGVGNSGKLESIQASIRQIAKHPLRRKDPMLRIVGVKMFQDGGMLTGSAYMLKPWGVSKIYSIDDPRYRGVLFIPKEKLLEIVRTTVESGLQYTAHSVGDGAVVNLVDVYEEINKTTPVRSTRPCITHCNFMTADAVARMAKLGVVCDIQPAWLYLDARTLSNHFGYDRLRYFQPLSSIFKAGGIVGGGSDHMQKIGSLRSVNPYNPFLGMWVTITRQARWHEGRLHPEEALSREQAIRFYTANNAYLLFLEDQVGSLETGKLADMIVLDRDILTCEVDAIKETRVLTTYLNGKVVHRRK